MIIPEEGPQNRNDSEEFSTIVIIQIKVLNVGKKNKIYSMN